MVNNKTGDILDSKELNLYTKLEKMLTRKVIMKHCQIKLADWVDFMTYIFLYPVLFD